MVEDRHTPVGVEDVERLAAETERLRAQDYREGGGTCREQAIACALRHDRLLTAEATDAVRRQLLVAPGPGPGAGRRSGPPGPGGRRPLPRRSDAVSRRAVAVLHANQARAHAGPGNRREAVRLLGAAHDEHARTPSGPAPGWSCFFDESDLCGLTGVVLTELVRTVDPVHTAAAIDSLTAAAAGYPEAMTRSRACSLTALTANHLVAHDYDHAAEVGGRAPAEAGAVRSTRVADRLAPLGRLADRCRDDPDAQGVSARIASTHPTTGRIRAVTGSTGVRKPSNSIRIRQFVELCGRTGIERSYVVDGRRTFS